MDREELEAIRPSWLAWWDGAREHSNDQPSYSYTRFFILRLLGFVYTAAFISLVRLRRKKTRRDHPRRYERGDDHREHDLARLRAAL